MNIAFVPIRSNNKSIPMKSTKNFCGKPLMYWCLESLQNCESIQEIYVGADKKELEDMVKSFGFSKIKIFQRDIFNISPDLPLESVTLDFLNKHTFKKEDTFILAQANNPFAQKSDYLQALELFEEGEYDSLLSCVSVKNYFWRPDGIPLNFDFLQRSTASKESDGLLMENRAFYISSVGAILHSQSRISGKTGFYVMPEFTATEIIDENEWWIAEMLMQKNILSNRRKINKVKLFATDVDGVLTDAGMYYTEKGDELKKFNTHDGMGLNLIQAAGVKIAMITSEDTNIVSNRSKKLKVDYLYQRRREGGKLAAVEEICEKEGITLDEVAYVGDDVNCYDVLSAVGLPACPNNAVEKIKRIPHIHHLKKSGGDGAVREFIDYLFSQGLV
jgi:N-acylneuraminate cytidylyltransferase